MLDLLAEDYAGMCKDMSQAEFEAAAFEAIKTSDYFPTVSKIRKAVAVVRAEQRREEIQEYEQQVEGGWTAEQNERAQRNARELLESLRTGRKPSFIQ